MQTPELVAGEKAGERGASVHGHVARGIDAEMTAGDCEFENLAQDAQRVIGAAGGGSTVGVEPVQDVVSGDAVERRGAEGGQELAGQEGVRGPSCQGLVPEKAGRIFVLTEAPGFQGGSSLGWTSCLSCGTSLLHRGCIGAGTGWSFRR